LLQYYSGRKAWLVEADEFPTRVTPYPAPGQTGSAAH
jgi:hypothetical protein